MIRYGNCQSTDQRVTLKLLQESQNYCTKNQSNNETGWGQWLMDDINQARALPKVQHRRVLTYSIQIKEKEKGKGKGKVNDQNKKYQNTKIANLRKLLAINFNKNAIESCQSKFCFKPNSKKYRKSIKVNNFEQAKEQLGDLYPVNRKSLGEQKIKTGREYSVNRKAEEDGQNKWSLGLLKIRQKSIFY